MDKQCEKCKNREGATKCTQCSRFYNDLFEMDESKSGVMCICCKQVITDGKIFIRKDNPRMGVCWTCW